jgi:hypothetical protein
MAPSESSLLGLGLNRRANVLHEENRLPLPPCPPKRGPLCHVGIMQTEFDYVTYERWAKELSEYA